MDLDRAFRISNPCAECTGTGEIEIQRAADAFTARVCESCWGNGYRVYRREFYESAAQAAADYPLAIIEEERR